MIVMKELKTFEDFASIKKGDVLACEFRLDVSDYPKKYRFNVFHVYENLTRQCEIVLQKKNNIYFNYRMFCDGESYLKSAMLITTDNEGGEK